MRKRTEIEDLVDKMQEHICDSLCRHPRQAKGEKEIEQICAECQMREFARGILNNKKITGGYR